MDSHEYDSFADLFPMPMTSIEKFHYWDCDSQYPNVIHCRLRFARKLDPDLAKQAWQLAIERQPFGDVEPKKVNGRWVWDAGPRALGKPNRGIENWNGTGFKFLELGAPPVPQNRVQAKIRSVTGSHLEIVVWPESAEVSESESVRQSAESGSRESPAKAWRSEVYFFVHHAIADGAAAAAVINEWIVIYSNLESRRPPLANVPQLQPALMSRRGQLGLLKWRYLKHVPKQAIAVFGATKFAFRKTVELLPGANSPDPEQPCSRQFPAILGRWISEADYQRLRSAARRHDVMLNSILLGQLYIALVRWRTLMGVHADIDWIRIILPMSIRNVSDRRLPAANRATLVQIDRRGDEIQDAGELYKSLDREIRIIRGWHLEKMFLIAMGCLAGFETFLQRAASNEKSRGTAVFTNLGEPLRKSKRLLRGQANRGAVDELIEFDPAGPIRKGTPVNFTASRDGSRLRISLHFDAAILNSEQATELLDGYVKQLEMVE